ncbi:protein-only RNase P domain-containing protein [Phthorimaea operculella]|nr:protein-only RNase P domain-containing protein [Phthorimaea operculella]
MFRITLSRFLLPSTSSYLRPIAKCSTQVEFTPRKKYINEQMEFIKAQTNKVDDWTTFRTTVLSKPGSVNEKNVDGVILKVMTNYKKIDLAMSYAEYLKKSGNELNLGVINALLGLYYELAKENPLRDEEKQFILNTYNNLYEKYEVLDSVTCERLLHALCAIGEWKKALKVLDDIFVTGSPTHSAFSTIIATMFNLNKKTEALKMIEKSLRNQRPLWQVAYESWINYILRKYKTKDTIVKYLDEICVHISKNCAVIPEKTAEKLRETYSSLGWHARITRIKKHSGECVYCRTTLDCLKLTEDEFKLLQKHVKDKIIVGSDILLKTSEEELKGFLNFIEQTAPYDIVLDALNICYSIGKYKMDKVGPLTFVIEHFRQQNKRILLIGRKHMLKWPKMKYVLSKTPNFLTDDASQDDPYFITAAILSGSHTDFVSKDLLRGHRFNLQDEQLRHLFQRWQWQHQWKVFINKNGVPIIRQKLLIMTMCQQRRPVMANNFNFEAITVSLIVLMGCWWSTSGTPDPRDHVPVEAARHAE